MLTLNKNIMASKTSTKQLSYWTGKFGNEYIKRNSDMDFFAKRKNFFKKLLLQYPDIKSILEIGCNIGGNLMVLYELDPSLEIVGIEPNKKAAKIARKYLPTAKI